VHGIAGTTGNSPAPKPMVRDSLHRSRHRGVRAPRATGAGQETLPLRLLIPLDHGGYGMMPKGNRCVCTAAAVGYGCLKATPLISTSFARGLISMRRMFIFASAAAAVLASTGCQQAWEGFRRFEARKYQAIFGTSPDACEPTVVVPTAPDSPVVYQPSMTLAPAAVVSPSACAACGSAPPISTTPSVVLPPATSVVPGTTTAPGPVQ
jgi:hypothetical protein